MKIGSLDISSSVLVAPMAGVTDYPYRQILRDMGAELLYTEMVSTKGLFYGNKKTAELITLDDRGYNGVQIFGAEPEIMAGAAKIVEREFAADLIDINLGCPAPKIVKNNYGSALMKDPELTADIVYSVVNSVKIPVTVKMRKGWNEDIINAVEIAEIAEENGAKAVAVHGRTREEYYSGKADWDIIARVKEEIDIPVIGNGDIFSADDAVEMRDMTSCDAVMLARGVQGNPYLVKNTISLLNSDEKIVSPNNSEKISLALEHLKKAVSHYGEKRAIPLMRKHLAWYVKGMPYSTNIKEEINHIKKYNSLKKLLVEYFRALENSY